MTVCTGIELVEKVIVLLSLVGGLYRCALLERQEVSSRDKANWDYI
jgi:hypothetical protein